MLSLKPHKPFFIKHKTTVLYAVILAVLLILLKWMEYKFLIIQHLLEVYTGMVALLFTSLGVWLALKLVKPKVEQVIVEREVFVPQVIPAADTDDRHDTSSHNIMAAPDTGLSKRELEVLQLMATGLSNAEISDRLFVSLSTTKTHASNIYSKLDVKRRTQAIEKAKRMSLIS